MPHKFENLDCYKRAVRLSIEIVKFSSQIRPFRFADQIAASSVSIPSNIAEGAQYASINNFSRFLSYSQGSAAELGTQLLILSEVHPEYSQVKRWREEVIVIQKMLSALQRSLRSRMK